MPKATKTPSDSTPLTPSERDELARLRVEYAQLKTRVQAPDGTTLATLPVSKDIFIARPEGYERPDTLQVDPPKKKVTESELMEAALAQALIERKA